MEAFHQVYEFLSKMFSMVTLEKIVAALIVFIVGFMLAYGLRRIVYRVTYKVAPLHLAKSLANLSLIHI